jgi:DNA polymerase I-like protein with 3'-5' exonuclease and polymerase domains
MPLGTTAAQRLLGIAPGTRNGGINNTHGTVTRDALDRFWIVPSFHPSYIQRGAHNLIGVCVHDFRLAAEIAIKGFTPVTPELTVDPSPDWFGKWVRDGLLWAEKRCVGNTLPPWLSADIETPEKAKGADEGELEAGKTKVKAVDLGTAEKPAELKDPTNVILRINFAYKQDHGITVPFAPAYMAGIRALLQSPFFSKVFWNKNYDIPRLEINGCHVAQPLHDFMDAWHVLQSDLPRGLGFVSPFYQKRPPWKHLSDENPGEYAAEDAVRTTVDAYGIEANLRELGMWDIYYRHIYKLDTLALKPAEEVGLRVFPGNVKKGTGLHGFSQELGRDKDRISDGIRENVPREIWPRKVYKTTRTFYEDDEKTKLKPEFEGRLEEFSEIVKQMHCSLCEKDGVRKGHENTKKCKGATLAIVDISVPRWNQILDFNPSSPDQMLKYIAHRGHKAGRNKKTKNPSADITALEALAKRHKKDPVYGPIMDLRKIDKMKGTYADGMLKRMDKDFRVHTTFMHKPSTLRLSSGDPSVMNLVKRGDDEETQYAKRFRECIVAEPGCVILEADYTGIEAVEVGWFSADPNYIRLASIGVHSYLCSHLLDKPADLTWEDDRLAEYLAEFKHSKDPATKAMYARSKRCVHGGNYGMTPAGMRANYPETFKTVAEATRVQDIYMAVCPKLRDWQRSIIQRANRQGYLGGDEHPFRYRHWFWNVINHKRLTRPQYLGQKVKGLQVIENDSGYWSVQYGDDAKRAIAFFPQSTAGGVLKEAMLALFDPELPETYIGDTYYGKTPFRMPIHDSLFLEVPNNKVDFVVERLVKVMTSPIKQQPCPTEWGIGQEDGLKMGVEIERGKDWSKMEEIDITQYGG